MNRRLSRVLALLVLFPAVAAFAAEGKAPEEPSQAVKDLDVLSEALTRPVTLLRGEMPSFTVTVTGHYTSDGDEVRGQVVLVRAGEQRWGLTVTVGGIRAELLRDAEETRLVVPPKGTALVGKGQALGNSPLAFDALVKSILALEPKAGAYVGLVNAADPGALALILYQFGQLERKAAEGEAKLPAAFVAKRLEEDRVTIRTTGDGQSIGEIAWSGPKREAKFTIDIAEGGTLPKAPTEGLKVVEVYRPELEYCLGRGLVRALDILYYTSEGDEPDDEVRKVDVARLMVDKGQRVALLSGSPYQIGFQHGKLLAREARRLCDAVLYCVGTAYSVEKQTWFLDEMRDIYKRLAPHIPAEYQEEMRGLAEGSGIPLESVRLANVFPALFHCSGFALLPEATRTGRLYHGRVLDYMTAAGLQRDAVIFCVAKDRSIPFANVGYAGFIGSVSGMNMRQVCFGEMGGGGAGKYDGTPMPILMRMGLERAGTLDEAKAIFKEAKRTCEYYYCISDAKIPDAVGVYATPEAIEFIRPGEKHELLPSPVEHALLMSAGDRYEALVERTKAKLGQFDTDDAIELMARPVAMKSNLHNVLFDPMRYEIHVAHARGSRPAYRARYVRYDIQKLFRGPKHPHRFPKAHRDQGDAW